MLIFFWNQVLCRSANSSFIVLSRKLGLNGSFMFFCEVWAYVIHALSEFMFLLVV